jgi:hypothetical protein
VAGQINPDIEQGRLRGDPKLTERVLGQYDRYIAGCVGGTGGASSGRTGLGAACFSFEQWKDKQGYGTDENDLVYVK